MRCMGTELGFEAAVAEAHRQRDALTALHAPAARPVLLDHGRRTPVAVTWLHGFTNCPRHFEALGRQCHERGWNVWIPLAPHHGLADRMTDATSLITTVELADWGNRAVDVARGLGERVVVGGLSMGGTVSAVLGLRRADVSLALPIAPVLSPLPLPQGFNRAAAAVLRALPDRMVWWDPKAKQSLAGPTHAYCRYSRRGILEIVRLGFAFTDAARHLDPAAAAFRFVLNDEDEALSNRQAEAVLARWKQRGVTNADAVHIGAALGLRHDFIDPDQPYAKIDVAYPILLEAIGRGLAGHPYQPGEA
jgi:pimeloyl-ACP methyl ester carboxylesterase